MSRQYNKVEKRRRRERRIKRQKAVRKTLVKKGKKG